MKKILFTFLVAAAFVPCVLAALYLEEAFPYAVGNLVGQGGWSGGSGSQVGGGSLNYPGLQSPTVTSNKVNLPSTASTATKSFNASPITSGSVYLSFIFKQNTLAASTSGSTIAGLDDDGAYTTGSGRVASALGVHVKQTNSTTYLVGIRKALGATAGGGTDLFYTGDSFVTNETVFIVAKYTFGAGAGDDTVTLWVNPATNSFGGIEPVASIAATNTGNTTDAAQLQYAFVRCNSSTTSGINEIDDVRVGSTWADVTPAGGVVQPPVTNSQPRITQSFLAPGGLVLRGTNGVTNGVYQVLSSTAVITPMTNWPAIGTNLFDASGNFDCTNPVSPSDAQRFYRILVGGQIVQPPTNPPSITTQPTNLIVAAGQTATFYGAASGTAPLAYQWFFNTNTPLANGANATYVITNAQAANEGSYTLRVTNSAGSVTSVVATLTVNVQPSITTQPQSQTVTAGNAASFTVIAAGDAPLSYQWYFSSAPILNGTNATYAISSALTNNAGDYFVIVTNNFGAVTSSVATLTVNAASGAPDFSMIGFATLSGFSSNGTLQAGGTTGGAGGIHVQVWTALELANHLQSNATLVIQVMTNIDLGIASLAAGITQPTYSNFLAAEVLVRSHKTLYSTNGSTLSHGTLRMGKPSLGAQQNIIIRNLKFTGLWEFDPSGNYDSKGWDYVHLEEGSHHVWVDHCDFDKVYDGIVDVVHASDYVTVSWCVFRDQKKCSLIGHSNNNQAEDTGHLNVTFHHNYYVNVDERLPRMRFGNAHVFNLYCEDLGGNGIQSTCEAATLVENSYFYHPVSTSLPTREENGTVSGLPNNGKGFLKVVNSTIVNLPAVNVQFHQFGEATFLFNSPFVGAVPPYPYTLDVTASVPNIVTNWSGVNKVTNLP